MAACRVGLYAAAGWTALSAGQNAVLFCGLGVGAYIVALSLFARKESSGTPPPRWVLLFLLTPLLARLDHADELNWWATAVLFLAWTSYACAPLIRRPGAIGPAIGKWLAGLVLIDLHYVSIAAPVAVWITLMGLFLLARALQAFAPAT
jgi:hypothetical protein